MCQNARLCKYPCKHSNLGDIDIGDKNFEISMASKLLMI